MASFTGGPKAAVIGRLSLTLGVRGMMGLRLLMGLPLLGLLACAPVTRVTPLPGGLYQIRQEGGWGYDLQALEQSLKAQAASFARAAGKDYQIVETTTEPDERVDVYPADDDTMTVTFRLLDPPKGRP